MRTGEKNTKMVSSFHNNQSELDKECVYHILIENAILFLEKNRENTVKQTHRERRQREQRGNVIIT